MLTYKPASDSRKSDFEPIDERALLREVVSLVKRRKELIASTAFAVFLLGLIYVLLASPVYVAEAELLIETKRDLGIGNSRQSEVQALDAPQLDSQVTLLESEHIVEMVTNDLKLASDPELVASPASDQSTPLDPDEALRRKRQLFDNFQRRLQVRRVGLSYTIAIGYRSGSPTKAASIANAVAEAYLRDQLEMNAYLAKEGSKWLEERLAEIRRKMNESVVEVQSFRAKRDYRIAKLPSEKVDEASKGTETTLEDLEVQAATYRKLYENHMETYFELLHRRSSFVPNARIITRALPPLAPVAPRSRLLLSAAAVVGLLLGFGLAMLLEMGRPLARE